MSLKTTFQKIPVTVFKVFKSLIVSVKYVKTVNDGFTAAVTTSTDIDALIISTTGVDITRLAFYHHIQPMDKLCFLKGVDVASKSIVVQNGDTIKESNDVFEVKELDVDAAGALYILLLRGVA